MTSKLAIGIGLLGLVSLGCNASTMIGEVPDGSSITNSVIGAGGSGMCTPPRDPNDHAFTAPAAVVGTWTGYFQGSILPVGADAIKLTIDQASDGSSQIQVVLGSNPPPPAATVATDLYPPALANGPAEPNWYNLHYIEGVTYPAHEVQWFGQRIKFVIAGGEGWDSWCQLQQSFASTQNGVPYYYCVPGGGAGGSRTGADGGLECYATLDSHGTTTPVDCDQVALCGAGNIGPCQCDECGCSKSMSSTSLFDITFDGDVATGTGSPGGNGYLRLTRATN
jgi:hypothetical protein